MKMDCVRPRGRGQRGMDELARLCSSVGSIGPVGVLRGSASGGGVVTCGVSWEAGDVNVK